MLKLLLKINVWLIVGLLTLFGVVASPEAYASLDAESVRVSFAAISDLHTESNNFDRMDLIIRGLRDISAGEGLDALVTVGDNTMNGQIVENMVLYAMLECFNKADVYISAAGNHDICNQPGGIDEAKRRFTSFYNAYTGADIDNFYYSTRVNGYSFLVIGSEEDAGVAATLSDAQLEWIDRSVGEAAAENKPVFIFCHQPMNGTNMVDYFWPAGALGEQSDELMAILMKYSDTDIFFFSGHMHNGLDASGITNNGRLYFIDLPVFGGNCGIGSITDPGMGYVVEVYDSSVEFRARCFESSEWISQCDRSIELGQ